MERNRKSQRSLKTHSHGVEKEAGVGKTRDGPSHAWELAVDGAEPGFGGGGPCPSPCQEAGTRYHQRRT